MRLAVFASGNGSNFQAIADSIIRDKYAELVILICDKECYAMERASKLDIPHYLLDKSKKRNEYEQDVLEVLKEHNVDFIALAGYMNIIGTTLLDAYENKIINIHPSLLPKYRGLHALERAFENQDTEIGITIHYVDKGIDTGKIIAQASIPNDGETLEKLEEKIHALEHKLYVKTLKGLLK